REDRRSHRRAGTADAAARRRSAAVSVCSGDSVRARRPEGRWRTLGDRCQEPGAGARSAGAGGRDRARARQAERKGDSRKNTKYTKDTKIGGLTNLVGRSFQGRRRGPRILRLLCVLGVLGV